MNYVVFVNELFKQIYLVQRSSITVVKGLFFLFPLYFLQTQN